MIPERSLRVAARLAPPIMLFLAGMALLAWRGRAAPGWVLAITVGLCVIGYVRQLQLLLAQGKRKQVHVLLAFLVVGLGFVIAVAIGI